MMAKKNTLHDTQEQEAEELITSVGQRVRDTADDLRREQKPPVSSAEAAGDAGDAAFIGDAALTGIFAPEERSLTFSGTALSALSKARTIGKLDKISQSTLTIGEVTIVSSTAKRLGVGEAKLLRYGVSAFTRDNSQNERRPTLRVFCDTRKFAIANKIAIEPKKMSTSEAQAKENRRAAKALENFLAKLAKNAENLKSGASFTWKETVKGKAQSYNGVSFISAYRIDTDVIMLEFSQSAAEYMVKLPILDTPRAYYAIDDRKPNAVALADALMRHYGMENNVIHNTERILKVETLLKHTSFPTIEEIRKKRWSWERLVKEPFEAAMDELYQKGFIAQERLDANGNRIGGGWRYCLSGMRELTDEQASTISRYEQFTSLYVYFELSDYKPHDVRAKAIAEKRAEQIESAQRKSRKTAKRIEGNA